VKAKRACLEQPLLRVVLAAIVASSHLASEAQVDSCLRGALAPESGIPIGLPAAEAEARLSYVREKKLPQMRWMLWHLEKLLAARQHGEGPLRPIVDLGCGKGDFTLLVAAALPSRCVIGIDTNTAAIDAARVRASASGLSNVRFECGDARMLLNPSSSTRAPISAGQSESQGLNVDGDVDALVALHACGGLSDTALDIAVRRGASALICTCCFNKHRGMAPAAQLGLSESDKDVICRMADCMQPTLSAEARRLVNSMRLARAHAAVRPDRRVTQTSVRTFPEAFSRQNFVLALECDECYSS